MGVSTDRLTPRLSASSTSSTPSITHQHCPQRGATVRRVPKTPVHCPFLPWEYYYNGALAPPSPPALPLLCPPPRASCALHCGSGRRAAAARVRPPRPSSWSSMTKVQKSGNSRAKPIPVECSITEVSSLRVLASAAPSKLRLVQTGRNPPAPDFRPQGWSRTGGTKNRRKEFSDHELLVARGEVTTKENLTLRSRGG